MSDREDTNDLEAGNGLEEGRKSDHGGRVSHLKVPNNHTDSDSDGNDSEEERKRKAKKKRKKKEQRAKKKKKEKTRAPRKDWHQKLFKTPKEVYLSLSAAAQKKSSTSIDKYFTLAVVGGIFIGFGAIFAISIFKGVPTYPIGIQKLLLCLTFPIGLILIVLLGAELFTGNTMYMTVGLLQGTVTIKSFAHVLIMSYFGNFAGALIAAYFFGYLTDTFVGSPYEEGVMAIAESKVSYNWGVTFLKAIPANWLVCVSIIMANIAEDVSGKVLGVYLGVGVFSAIGYEHSIANMVYIPLGMFYGADVGFGEFLYANLIPVTLGNIIGGTIFTGAIWWYVFSFDEEVGIKQELVDVQYTKISYWNFAKRRYAKWQLERKQEDKSNLKEIKLQRIRVSHQPKRKKKSDNDDHSDSSSGDEAPHISVVT